MPYQLLTGATGLLGRYVLRGLLLRDLPVAVVVRPSKFASAIERVEAVLGHWEAELGRSLPRPVVLEGELCQENLGLDAAGVGWLREHCPSVLHCAASMVFREDKRGEPFRTNVEGTRRLVELCRTAGIRQFHHVSTAYVCGLRTGRVLETELDLGQELGNVYEKSKLAAETIVRQADHFDCATFYRPASIVGDSSSGYVTSYHGFYLPLQLACAMAGRIPPEQMNQRFLAALGLSGHEGKNFVPVDWVAEALVRLVTTPELHGATYHLASPEPVTVELFQRVVQEAIRRYWPRPTAQTASPDDLAAYEGLFQQYMAIYRSHWRNDPVFDLTGTYAALPDLPCPTMDFDLLMRVARYPVANNFAPHKREAVRQRFDVRAHLARWRREGSSPPGNGRGERLDAVDLEVAGPGGGQWQLWTDGTRLLAAEPGLDGRAAAGCYLHADTFAALAAGRTSLERSIATGRIVLHGRADRAALVPPILQQLLVPSE